MLLLLKPTDINNENIMFGEKTINNIIENSFFYQIYYSNNIINLNCITCKFKLYNIEISNHFNKHKITFKTDDINNNNSINNLIKMEYDILHIFQKNQFLNNKFASYKINDIFTKNYIKGIFKKNIVDINNNVLEATLLIKISGIWENTTHYGLNYKFLN